VPNTLANWALVLPGLIALALLPRLYLRLIELSMQLPSGSLWGIAAAVVACVCLVVAVFGACLFLPRPSVA
jgi:hypothetical protein